MPFLIGAGVIVCLAQNPQQSSSMNQSGLTKINGLYVEYSTSELAKPSEKKVLLFYASWCPTCRPVNEELTQNYEKIPEYVRIIRVNYNDADVDANERELAKKYGITYQHTFVLTDNEGNMSKNWNGGDLSTILTNLN